MLRYLPIAIVCCVGLLAAPAGASVRANSDTYSFSRIQATTTADRCLRIELDGSYTYSAHRVAVGGHTTYWLTGIKISNPRMAVTSLRYDSVTHACTSSIVNSTHVTANQAWAGYACSFNPSISVSVPFGISVGGWPSCGNKTRAVRGSSFSNFNSVIQDNSGTPVAFADAGLQNDTHAGAPCYGSYVYGTVKNGALTQTYATSRFQFCLTPAF